MTTSLLKLVFVCLEGENLEESTENPEEFDVGITPAKPRRSASAKKNKLDQMRVEVNVELLRLCTFEL